jgi:osmotically-inducible protein OsmY
VSTGCAAGDKYHQSTGEAIDDHGISSRVKHALANDGEYKYDDVQVTTFKGTVQLSGFVEAGSQKSRAGELAKGVEGVQEVVNNITVK